MAIAAFIFVFAIISITIYVRFKNRRVLLLANRFPGPTALPFFGNALFFIGKSPSDMHKFVVENRQKYGRIWRVWMFNFVGFMISDPKVLEIIMSSSTLYMAKSRMYGLMRSWLGDGLLLSSGKKWHKRRKIITPAFHFSILEQFTEIFDQQSRIMASRLWKLCDGCTVDIHPFVSQMALDVVCETAMGVQINAQTETYNKYVEAVVEITEAISNRVANVWQRYDLLFYLFGGKWKRKIDDCLHVLHNFTNSIILKRREELVRKINASEESPSKADVVGDKGKRMALLDILLQSTIDGQPLSNEDIREEVDTFMFEGHDTTTIGIAFTLYCLSRHKDVQDKLFAEIRIVCGDDKNESISYRQLNELKYIDSVIKESFRLYPPVPSIGRLVDADINLDDGMIIPKGTMLSISLFVMFRDAEYFPDPLKFDPTRFTNDTSTDTIPDKTSSFAYIPFSAGARNCIGQKFAMLEVKSAVSKILRNFELLPVGDEPEVVSELVLRTKNGVQLGLKPRSYD